MKGIVLAGGLGTRLHPLTHSISKQLLPVYDKPMIYYSISVLMLAKIKDILIISSPESINQYKDLLGSGSRFGINLSYKVQKKPEGIAQSLVLASSFIKKDSICLILGDNIFFGQDFANKLENIRGNIDQNGGACIFGYPVKNPSEFGVIDFKKNGEMRKIKEKPKNSNSNIAVTGLYFYDNSAISKAKTLKPSARGEYEITDLNNLYISEKKMSCEELGRGFAWLDTGTHESLLEAGQFISTIEKRQGLKVACLEEIGLGNNWLSSSKITENIPKNSSSNYYHYLQNLVINNESN